MKCSNMVANILPAYPSPSTLGDGVNRSKFMAGEIAEVRIATKCHMRALVNIKAQECLIITAINLGSIPNATQLWSHSYHLLYKR